MNLFHYRVNYFRLRRNLEREMSNKLQNYINHIPKFPISVPVIPNSTFSVLELHAFSDRCTPRANS